MVRQMPVVAIVALGCAPQNAELTSGGYRAFLHESTSFSVQKDEVELGEFEEFYNIDCRDLADTPDANEDGSNDDEQERLRLDPKLEVCDGNEKKGNLSFPAVQEGWLNEGAFHVVANKMEPWRGEAIMTSEGDFQVTFHQKLPGGSDMRFAFAVDPVFQPQNCLEDGEGGVAMFPVDGDWLGGWAEDLTAMDENDDLHPALDAYRSHFAGGTLYYLQARAFQFDPEHTENTWSLPNRWRDGFTVGKFSEEFFHARTVRFGEPGIYASFENEDGSQPTADQLFYCGETGDCDALCDDVNTVADDIASELAIAGPDGVDAKKNPNVDLEWYRPLVHCNTWRDPDLDGDEFQPGEPDGRPPGLDGWVGLHYNWVIIDAGSTLEVGGSASGAFSFVYDADESRSRFFIQGEFTTEKIKSDRWTTDDIEAIKLAENGTTLCE